MRSEECFWWPLSRPDPLRWPILFNLALPLGEIWCMECTYFRTLDQNLERYGKYRAKWNVIWYLQWRFVVFLWVELFWWKWSWSFKNLVFLRLQSFRVHSLFNGGHSVRRVPSHNFGHEKQCQFSPSPPWKLPPGRFCHLSVPKTKILIPRVKGAQLRKNFPIFKTFWKVGK